MLSNFWQGEEKGNCLCQKLAIWICVGLADYVHLTIEMLEYYYIYYEAFIKDIIVVEIFSWSHVYDVDTSKDSFVWLF